MPQPLGSKESSLFRQVVKNYESKQHKKGLKAADQILRKSPNHGDTQAMKALILNAMSQSDDAFNLAKTALKNDMKSHVCWHVYGLLWRSQYNYEEAAKAYKFALKLEPDSPQILRDLSLLQVQLRDYQGYIESRRTMLQKRQVVRQNWTALAVAHHLAGEMKAAENVLSLYEGTLKQAPPKTDIEHSEAVLYKNTVIAETGDIQRALDHLESVKNVSLDRTAVMEMRADYLLQLQRYDEAETAYRDLITRNPELRVYYECLERALGMGTSDKSALKELYASYARSNKRLDAARRIPLDFLTGGDFQESVDQYLRHMLSKGVPSTFNNVKSLYVDEEKRQIIQELVEGYANEKQVNGDANADGAESPRDRFQKSSLYFLAQHYNYWVTRDLPKAMSYTEKLIELAPEVYDYHMNKARIYKHRGNIAQAAKTIDHARGLDLKDRYINTKCAKYQLRNNENDSALKTMSKFTRNEVAGGTLGDIIEMQALWYLTEDGESYARKGELGLALKRFYTVFNTFDTWEEDQFDFHTFSLRKAQIRAYIDMVRWEDDLRDHPAYSRAAVQASQIYLRLHEHPELSKDQLANGTRGSNESETRRKARKESDKSFPDQKDPNKKPAQSQDVEAKTVDEDPSGKKLLETKEPLDVAAKILGPLLETSSAAISAQLVGFEVHARRKKYFLALKCLFRSFEMDSSNPYSQAQAIRFCYMVQEDKANPDTAFVLEMFMEAIPAPFNTPSSSLAASLDEKVLSKNTTSAPHVLAVIQAKQVTDPSAAKSSQQPLLQAVETCVDMTLQEAAEGLLLLRDIDGTPEQVDEYLSKASKRWPDGRSFLERKLGR